MLDFSPGLNRMLSMLGQRGSFGYALTEAARENKRILALSADLCNTSGLDRFLMEFPDRMINVGIAEQNLLGVSAGLADQGYIPFATTFSNFATMRACEWVKHFMGYMRCNIKLIGFGAGFAMELFGNTHYGVEDIAAVRSIPNITIFSPADGLEVAKCVSIACNSEEPTYIRLTGKMNSPIVHRKDITMIPGKAIELRAGEDVAIFATGGMVSVAMNACEKLAMDSIDCALYDIHTIKPLDGLIPQYGMEKRLMVSIEEHSIVGGLGSAIAESISGCNKTAPLLRLGIQNGYKRAGDYQYMLDQNRLNVSCIVEDIKRKLKEIKND